MREDIRDNTDNKKLAKNTIYLYLRLLVSLVLNLYISRLLLEVLGVKDFGTYNIVGGFVMLMLFVNSTMQNASLRFINISLGKGDVKDIRSTISSSIQIHIFISILFLLVGETIGLWYVTNELNVPERSYETVLWLYQLSLITAGISVIQVPLIAVIMSYERMDAYAFIEILNVILRCIIIFLLPLFSNRLLLYGLLLLFVSLVIFCIYLIYSRRNFVEFTFNRKINKEKISAMTAFAMYNLIGDGTFAVRQQGTNLMINKFFGVGLNAASGVATQAASLISTFISNTQSAFKPQIIKEYSANNILRMKELLMRETEIMFILLSLILSVVYINIDFLMALWLKDVPHYAVEFCRAILICNALVVFLQILATAIHASGKVRKLNFVVGALNVSCLLFVYVFFACGFDSVFAYYSYMLIIVLKILGEAIILKENISAINYTFLLAILIKPILLLIASFIITYSLSLCIDNPPIRFIASLLVNTITVSVLSYLMYPYIRNVILINLKKIL